MKRRWRKDHRMTVGLVMPLFLGSILLLSQDLGRSQESFPLEEYLPSHIATPEEHRPVEDQTTPADIRISRGDELSTSLKTTTLTSEEEDATPTPIVTSKRDPIRDKAAEFYLRQPVMSTKERLERNIRYRSSFDFDGDGRRDDKAIVRGARKDIETVQVYDPVYVNVNQGYPDPSRGVCTDTIWRAFAEAGYDLKQMIDRDIKRDRSAYPRASRRPDPMIDFRRVPNMAVFFDKYAQKLPIQTWNPDAWQPGDIVVFGKTQYHIGIIGDRKDENGYYMLLNHSIIRDKEIPIFDYGKVTAHYRWFGAEVPKHVLVKWKDPLKTRSAH